MLPIQRQDTLTGGSVPLEVIMTMVFINLAGVLVQSNPRKQNLLSLLGSAHFHQLLQTSFNYMKLLPSSIVLSSVVWGLILGNFSIAPSTELSQNRCMRSAVSPFHRQINCAEQ